MFCSGCLLPEMCLNISMVWGEIFLFFLSLSVVFFVTAWMCVSKLPTLYIYFFLLTQRCCCFLSEFVAEFVLENEV